MHLVVGLHGALGEGGALCFLWVVVEILNGSLRGLVRARRMAVLGCALILGSWLMGGYYYITHYRGEVRPVIKAGAMPWIHSVIWETKEHVFLFLPILAISALLMLRSISQWDDCAEEYRRALVVLCSLIVIAGFSMAGLGYLISATVRAALGGGI